MNTFASTVPESITSNTKVPGGVALRAPSKYSKAAEGWQAPPLEWLERQWTVTHSTLPMWRKAKNVRITYKVLKDGKLDDLVESVPTEKTWLPQPKAIHGVDTPSSSGVCAWDWRGKGLLKIASSHWEVLGWGESEAGGKSERWVVTWFEKSMFTPEGVDVYCDAKGGISEELYAEVLRSLEALDAKVTVESVKRDMKSIFIDDA
jgi:hypothetical protein